VIFTLPNSETMLRRLLAVSDDSCLREHLYPLLLKRAGMSCTNYGPVLLLATDLMEYHKQTPSTRTRPTWKQIHELVKALTDNPEAQVEAERFLDELPSSPFRMYQQILHSLME